ncbi:MAG: aldehyde dehydrogenase (NADP(+)) [Planctomycetes bacterium]|nr:aldehyde dehydrogenase (NADP(+)) [Planctomycetota bacterium]
MATSPGMGRSSLRGRSLIAGQPSADTSTPIRSANPLTGGFNDFSGYAASSGEVADAARRAMQAFRVRPTEQQRAAILEGAAQRIADLGDELIAVVRAETALPPARIAGERDRTVNQLRMFASLARDESWVEAVRAPGDPQRKPQPRPDLRRMLRPIGPVAVFGASNFPLAFSVAGGDTASALAAGCSVVVKGHSAHPMTGELVAQAVAAAVCEAGVDPGCFSFLHAGGARDIEVGIELVRSPDIRAVGFTGSPRGGRRLMEEAARRDEPIPVFAEMGSLNPIVVLPSALRENPAALAQSIAASVTNSAGQMCTCPGLVCVIESVQAEEFARELRAAIRAAGTHVMLTAQIRANYLARLAEIRAAPGIRETAAPLDSSQPNKTGPVAPTVLFEAPAERLSPASTLSDECFGPATVLVRCRDMDELLAVVDRMPGSLAASVFAADAEDRDARGLLDALAERAGRVILNGAPTGVEVSPAMVHSGPFPACSRPDSSAVGVLAIRRWCRPVCYQNVPEAWLPAQLR